MPVVGGEVFRRSSARLEAAILHAELDPHHVDRFTNMYCRDESKETREKKKDSKRCAILDVCRYEQPFAKTFTLPAWCAPTRNWGLVCWTERSGQFLFRSSDDQLYHGWRYSYRINDEQVLAALCRC